jgi:spore coat protein U-like protein
MLLHPDGGPVKSLALCALALCPVSAWAITCTVTDVTPASFGAYDVFATSPLDTTGSVSFVCTGVSALDTVTVDLSTGDGASFAGRVLSGGGGQELAYNLYLDAARTTVWGDGSGVSATYGPVHPPDGTTVSVPVYGRAEARQSVPAGTYGDSVAATIHY